MSTSIRIFSRQLLRSKKRLILNILLLTAVTAFFVMSLNLYWNTTENLQKAEDAYSTIATVEVYGDVNSAGDLVLPGTEGYVGYHLLNAAGMDFSALLAPDYVIGSDLRWRCAAYIPGMTPLYLQNAPEEEDDPVHTGSMQMLATKDVIRFRILGDEPQVLQLGMTGDQFQRYYLSLAIEVIDQSRKDILYPENIAFEIYRWRSQEDADWYAADIRRLNRSDNVDSVTLYPGVEYVASVSFSSTKATSYFSLDQQTGKWRPSNPMLRLFWNEYDQRRIKETYTEEGEEFGSYFTGPEVQQPFFLHRWEDIQANAEEAAYWDAVWDAAAITGNSFAVTLTGDITKVPAWHLGGMYLHSGRMITKEEYASGAKVCMISKRMADYHGLSIGDTLDMNLYSFDNFYDLTGTWYLGQVAYEEGVDGFFDKGTYQIVGLFGQHEIIGTSEVRPEILYQPWNAIYVPTASVSGAPNPSTWDVRPSLMTINLKNGSIDQFQAAVDAMGLTDKNPGEYSLHFNYFDQGYSMIHGSLIRMYDMSRMLLMLSIVLLLTTLFLAAFFFAQQHKQSAGILRVIGGSKAQALAGILVCALSVALVGTALGGLLGGTLGQIVGNGILTSSQGRWGADEFSPDLLNFRSAADTGIAAGSDLALTVLGSLGCLVLFLLLLWVFVSLYIRQEPRKILDQRNA